MKSYNVFKISSVPFLPDILSGLLWELEITGVTENDDTIIAFAAEDSPVNEEMINGLLNKLVDQNVIKEFSVTREILKEKTGISCGKRAGKSFAFLNELLLSQHLKNMNPVQMK